MLTKIEKETIINFNEYESECEVYTFNGKLIRSHCVRKKTLWLLVAIRITISMV